jgi:hypothetical protein
VVGGPYFTTNHADVHITSHGEAQDLGVLSSNLPKLSLTKWDLDPTCRWSSCHGPAGGAPAAGVGGGVSPAPSHLARRGEIATKTQELRPALSVNTQPNHVLPLAHFGALSDVHDGGVVRADQPP